MQDPAQTPELLQQLLFEDHDLLKGIFRDLMGFIQDRMPIFLLDNWPVERRVVLDRLVRRGLVRLEHRHPVPQYFPMWLLVKRPAVAEKNLAELEDEYLQTETIPMLFLTEEGKYFLAH